MTPRGRDVLWLVERGLTNKEAAAELHLSEHTVRNHVAALFREYGATTRTELVRIAADHPAAVVRRAVPDAPCIVIALPFRDTSRRGRW